MATPTVTQLDGRNVKPAENFSGKVEDWEEWRTDTYSYLSVLGYRRLVDAAMSLDESPALEDMAEQAEAQAQFMYHMLLRLCKGKAKIVARKVEIGNGFVLWRALHEEYEPKKVGRHQSMLQGLVSPTEWEKMNKDQFEIAFLEWETAVDAYEKQTQKEFGDDQKCAVVCRWVPDIVKGTLMLAAPEVREDFDRLRATLMALVKGAIQYDGRGRPMVAAPAGGQSKKSDPDAMQCDAAYNKGLKEGKSKGKKGNGKFGKNKSDKTSKTAGKEGKVGNDSKGKTYKSKFFEGNCKECGKYGHKAADCWSKKQTG